MLRIEGIHGIRPVIKKVTFTQRGKMDVHLEDGRTIIVPLRLFPSIQKLNEAQRKKITIVDDQILMFRDCDEIFHIQQVLGDFEDYKYDFTRPSTRQAS